MYAFLLLGLALVDLPFCGYMHIYISYQEGTGISLELCVCVCVCVCVCMTLCVRVSLL